MGRKSGNSGQDIPKHLFWASTDGVLTAELEHKQYKLGNVATGGSVKVALLLHKPAQALPSDIAAMFSPWESTDPIRFEIFAQYDLLGKQVTRILSIYNTDGIFKGHGINAFLMNTLVQYMRIFMNSDSLVVVNTSGEPDAHLLYFYRELFKVKPDLHGDFVQQLSNLSFNKGMLFGRYDCCIPLSDFSAGAPPSPTPNANNF